MAEYSPDDILALIFSFIFPPIGVAIKRGWYFPGIIHAIYIIYKYRNEPTSSENPARTYPPPPSVAIPINDDHTTTTTTTRQIDKSSYKTPENTQNSLTEFPPSSTSPEPSPEKIQENIPKSELPSPHYGTHTLEDTDPNRYKKNSQNESGGMAEMVGNDNVLGRKKE
ncbi:19696_t:CDS:2 [Cetraspora pellucida]|uniref:19696_t:CDS:1 n=1 Tax=Cetraspora pellucida TaxID=1433469 RepID=A0A9N8WMU3_9GLOM|nr:19696_t:CDS:2 [Cetraspora pellucida]